MLRFWKTSAVWIALIGMTVAGLAWADDGTIINPEFQAWAKFRAGSMIKQTSETDAMGNKTISEIMTTLTDINSKIAVLETQNTVTAGGKKMEMPVQTREVPVRIRPGDAGASASTQPSTGSKPEVGSEAVQVGDQIFLCVTSKVHSEQNGVKVETKTWTCEDVPGGMVKMESHTSGATAGSSRIVLVECETK